MIRGIETVLSAGWLDIVLQNNGDESDLFWMTVIGFGVGLYFVYKGVDAYRKSRLIQDTSTERVRSIAVGRTELEGVAREVDGTLAQPFTDGECLYASWEIEEYDRDPGDDTHSWETIESGSYTVPFYLEDKTGRIIVDATTDATWELSDGLTQEWTVPNGSTPNQAAAAFCEQQGMSTMGSHKRRYTQSILPPETSVYVLGEATPRDVEDVSSDSDRLKIQRDAGSDRFIISDMDESELAGYYSKRAPLYTIGGLVLSAGCLYYILSVLL